MSWKLIRDIGLITFIGGGFLLFAISASRYLDPPQNEKVRVLVDSWMWSIGDGMTIAGACVALLGMAGNLAQLYYIRTLMSDATSVTYLSYHRLTIPDATLTEAYRVPSALRRLGNNLSIPEWRDHAQGLAGIAAGIRRRCKRAAYHGMSEAQSPKPQLG